MRLRSRFFVVTLALGWLDGPASLGLGLVSGPLCGPALGLGLVSGPLCGPALGLAPVHPGLPACARASFLSRSRWAGLTARLPSDSAWSPGRCAALRSASLRSIRACQPALALLFYTQFALLELLPWSW